MTTTDAMSPLLKSQVKSLKTFRANIQEAACIGCTKCLDVCPTDAIVGANGYMHTVIADACTGCGWCVPLCPVDCIELVASCELTPADRKLKHNNWRKRHAARKTRLLHINTATHHHSLSQSIEMRQATIQAALSRVKKRKLFDGPEDL